MANELFQVRLPDDFAGWVHDYKDDNAMTKSEAIRSLLRSGLDAEGYGLKMTTDGGRPPKEWLALYLGRWADRSMYAGLVFGVLTVAASLPAYLDLVEATLPMALAFVAGTLAMALFVAMACLLSIASIGLMIWAGTDLKDALPWRASA